MKIKAMRYGYFQGLNDGGHKHDGMIPISASREIIVHPTWRLQPLDANHSQNRGRIGSNRMANMAFVQHQVPLLMQHSHEYMTQLNNNETAHASPPLACKLMECPDETITNILSFLGGKSLVAVSSTSQLLHSLSNCDSFWFTLCQQEWGIQRDRLTNAPATHKGLYRLAIQTMKRLTQDVLEEQCLMTMQTSWDIPRSTALDILRSVY